MAKVKLIQQGKDITIMIKTLLAVSKTDLSKVCEDNKLEYRSTYSDLNKNSIDLDWLKNLVQLINPKANIEIDFSIRVLVDGNEIYTQKTFK